MRDREAVTTSPEQTKKLAGELALELKRGDVVALIGELGAGKTVFTRGLCHALGSKNQVNSPTFTLVNIYSGKFMINHVDCYRLDDPSEFEDLDPESLLEPEGITIIEWAEKIESYLPDNYWRVEIQLKSENERAIKILRIGSN